MLVRAFASASGGEAASALAIKQQQPLVGQFFVRIAPDPGPQHPVAILLSDQRAIHGGDMRIQVLVQHHPLGGACLQRGDEGRVHRRVNAP